MEAASFIPGYVCVVHVLCNIPSRNCDLQVTRTAACLLTCRDVQASGGYRDILMNLRLCNRDCMDAGVYHHVVELQLLLIDFAKLRTENGHRRYIEFRNKRGE